MKLTINMVTILQQPGTEIGKIKSKILHTNIVLLHVDIGYL